MTTYTPRELAAELGYTNESRPGKVVRDYLRQIRLHRVRAQLVAGEARTTVIADVARGWGFGHLGRFASYYADTFGERPSDTLRRPSR